MACSIGRPYEAVILYNDRVRFTRLHGVGQCDAEGEASPGGQGDVGEKPEPALRRVDVPLDGAELAPLRAHDCIQHRPDLVARLARLAAGGMDSTLATGRVGHLGIVNFCWATW